MVEHPAVHKLVPSVHAAIERVRDKLAAHLERAHPARAAGAFLDCSACGALEHRLSTLVRHRDAGNLFVPVKGLVVDEQGELCFEDVMGQRHYGAALHDHIDRTLCTFGLLGPTSR